MSPTAPVRPSVRVDESAWPIVLFVFDGEQGEADVAHYLELQSQHYGRDEVFASITIMHRFSANRKLLQQLGEWMKAHRDTVHRLHAGGAIVSTSATFRFILSSFYLIQPPANPYKVVDALQDAVPWVREQLAEHDIETPSTVELLARFKASPAMPAQ